MMTGILESAKLVGRDCSFNLLVLQFDPNIGQRTVNVGLPLDFSSCGGVRTSVTGIRPTQPRKKYIHVDIRRILCNIMMDFSHPSLHSFISRIVWE